MSLRHSLALLLLSVPAVAVAQTHFCMGGELDRMSSTDVAACKAKMYNVREAVKMHGAPSGWRFIVVCDEAGWNDVSALTGSSRASFKTIAYHTDGEMHLTFLRASRLATTGDAADLVLASALKSLPNVQPLPNPKRVPAPATVVMADAKDPQANANVARLTPGEGL